MPSPEELQDAFRYLISVLDQDLTPDIEHYTGPELDAHIVIKHLPETNNVRDYWGSTVTVGREAVSSEAVFRDRQEEKAEDEVSGEDYRECPKCWSQMDIDATWHACESGRWWYDERFWSDISGGEVNEHSWLAMCAFIRSGNLFKRPGWRMSSDSRLYCSRVARPRHHRTGSPGEAPL